jgi:hypothetical protein
MSGSTCGLLCGCHLHGASVIGLCLGWEILKETNIREEQSEAQRCFPSISLAGEFGLSRAERNCQKMPTFAADCTACV